MKLEKILERLEGKIDRLKPIHNSVKGAEYRERVSKVLSKARKPLTVWEIAQRSALSYSQTNIALRGMIVVKTKQGFSKYKNV
jgi:hypothetical protein